MPSIDMYLEKDDLPILTEILNSDEEIAFLVSAGDKQWKAVKIIQCLESKKYALWHIPAGKLDLIGPPGTHKKANEEWVENPWKGWTENRTGRDSSVPFFGSYPKVIELNVAIRIINLLKKI